jgi:hypothetical protein
MQADITGWWLKNVQAVYMPKFVSNRKAKHQSRWVKNTRIGIAVIFPKNDAEAETARSLIL